jgi:SGNH domain (fused to AT3 domains)
MRFGGTSRVPYGLVVTVTAVLVACATAHAAAPRCFGAAARDAAKPCTNPALRLSVTPTPEDAVLESSAACAPLTSKVAPARCSFGTPSKQARQTVALIGDSHAVHWRAALQHVFKVHRWRGITIYRSQCPFTGARTSLAEPDGSGCEQWKRDTFAYLSAHPEIDTIFVSGNTGAGVVVPSGQNRFEVKTAGYATAWSSLPASIRHIVVLRDPPHNRETTAACVERAIERRKPAGTTCQVPVATALASDPALEAAKRLDSPRVQAIDLTPFMCDAANCFPVIGGALVHKDVGHISTTFSTTLGPYLLRELNARMAEW